MKKGFRQIVFVLILCVAITKFWFVTGCGGSAAPTASLLVTLFDKDPGTQVTADEIAEGRVLPRFFSGTITFLSDATEPIVMDPDSVRDAITIKKDETELVMANTLDLAWNDDLTAVTITPHRVEGFDYDASYTIAISEDAKTASGEALTAFSVVFDVMRFNDVNGDKYAELAVSAPCYPDTTDCESDGSPQGRSYLFHGPNIPSAGKGNPINVNNDDATILYVPDKQVGTQTWLGGNAFVDINRDGYADWFGSYNSAGTAHFFVFLGANGSDAKLAGKTITAGDADISWVGGTFYPIISGDFNGDGFIDMGLIDSMCEENTGCVYIDYGPILPSSTPRAISGLAKFTGERPGSAFGEGSDDQLQILSGDINDDGIADLIVGAAANNDNQGAVYVFYGSTTKWASKSASKADIIIRGEGAAGKLGNIFFPLGQYGYSALESFDVNGDGIDDIAVSAPEYGTNTLGRTYVFLGGKDSTLVEDAASTREVSASIADIKFTGYQNTGKFSDNFVFGDVSGDGKLDLVAYANPTDGNGFVYIFVQPDDGFPSETSAIAATKVFQGSETLTNMSMGPLITLGSNKTFSNINVNVGGGTDSACKTDDVPEPAGYYIQGGADIASRTLADAWVLCAPTGLGFQLSDGFMRGIADFLGDGTRAAFIGSPRYDNTRGLAYVIFSTDMVFGTTTWGNTLPVRLKGENEWDALGY